MQPQISKIVYATDMSDSSRLAFQYALSLAQKYEATITIVHILRDLPSYMETMSGRDFDTDKLINESKQALNKEVVSFCEAETCNLENGSDLIGEIIVDHGEPGWRVIEIAEKSGADLIVLGQHGRTALTDLMLMGGTARKVVNHSKIPVLTVRLPKD